jgi:hypothetical protein
MAKENLMAGKPLNRLDLRRQREAAEPLDPMEDEVDEIATEDEEIVEGTRKKKSKAATKAKPKAKAKAKPKTVRAAKPATRMRIVWAVLNDAFKQVATFEYNQKDAAFAKAAELTAKGKGTHFVQRLKEPMPDDAPGIGASLPRATAPAAKPARVKATPVLDEEEEINGEDDEDEDIAVDDEDDEDE